MKKFKHALITGATSGIGLSLAHQLAHEGTNLILVARRTDRLVSISQELMSKYSIQVDILSVDLTQRSEIQSIIQFCKAQKYSIDLLINNAGFGPYKKFTENSLESHLMVLEVNTIAPMVLSYQFLEHMKAHSRPSCILNVGSVAGYIPVSGFTVYSATKTFLSIFSNVLDYELKDTNISVSCLYPGATTTEFAEKNNQVVVGSNIFFMSADAVAKIALNGIKQKKKVIIPGFLNKLQVFMSHFIPGATLLKISSFAMGTAVQEKA